MSVAPIPPGYHSITPYFYVRGAAKALEFYQQAFGAQELMRMPQPNGSIGHAEIQIGDSRLMLADEMPEMGITAPVEGERPSVAFCIYLENVDAAFERAVAAGATIDRPLQNQFYGDRSGTVKDPFGHYWTLATHVEDVSPEEIERRFKEMVSQV